MGLPEKAVILELFLFLTPGILIIYCLGLIRVGPRLEYKFLLLHYIVAATFFYIVFYPIFNFENGFKLPLWLYNLLFYFFSPILVGLGLCYFSKYSLVDKFWILSNIKANIPIDDAWDYVFGKTLDSGKYVIITLKSDEVIYGFIGPSSFAGNTPNRRDIFIEKIFELDEDNAWVEILPERSIYLKEQEVRFMEFINV